MRIFLEFIKQSTIFVLFFGLGIFRCEAVAQLQYCETNDCVKTGTVNAFNAFCDRDISSIKHSVSIAKMPDLLIRYAFDLIATELYRNMNWNASNRCDNFYNYACRSDNEMYSEIFAELGTQENYLRRWFKKYNRIAPIIQLSQPSDPPHVRLINQYRQLCTDRSNLKKDGVKPIVNFLNTAPVSYDKSWWELENWAVFNGFSSTLFSVHVEKNWTLYDQQGFIILQQPHTRSHQKNHFKTSRNLMKKLKEAGLHTILADRLSDGITKEKEFYSTIMVPNAERHRRTYAERWISMKHWNDLWNIKRRVSSNLTQNDWDNYLNNYWNGSVNTDGIVPLLKNGRFKLYIGESLLVEALGSALERFTDDNMKNILLWRMVVELVEYGGNQVRELLELLPIESCLTPATRSALQKNFWYSIIPKSVRIPIQEMYTKIDLQIKLLNYKDMRKVPSDAEPLSNREVRHLRALADAMTNSKQAVRKLEAQLNAERQTLRYMEEFKFPFGCQDSEFDNTCSKLYRAYYRYQRQIPKKKKFIEILEAKLDAKRNEYNRSNNRLLEFQNQHIHRLHGAEHEPRTTRFQSYIKQQPYPKFPFVDTLTRPKSMIRTPATDADYVELGMSLNKWKRAMLLQAPETFKSNIDDEKFAINGFTSDLFARFKTDRPSSLNYGALGSALGYGISLGLRNPVVGGNAVMILDSYINRNLLWRKDLDDFDWRTALTSFIISNARRIYNFVDMPVLLSTFADFLKQNPDSIQGRYFNVTEWLLMGYEVTNTEFGLKAAWNARQHDLRFNPEKDERLIDIGKNRLLSEFNQDMLFFQSFGYSRCEADYLNIGKTTVKTILKRYSKFDAVYRNKSICIAPF